MKETNEKHGIALEVKTEADADIMKLKYGLNAKVGIYCVHTTGRMSWHNFEERDFLVKYGYLILPVSGNSKEDINNRI